MSGEFVKGIRSLYLSPKGGGAGKKPLIRYESTTSVTTLKNKTTGKPAGQVSVTYISGHDENSEVVDPDGNLVKTTKTKRLPQLPNDHFPWQDEKN